MKKLSEILDEPRHWCRGLGNWEAEGDEYSCCLGAAVCRMTGFYFSEDLKLTKKILFEIALIVFDMFGDRLTLYKNVDLDIAAEIIVCFNDDSRTTFEEIQQVARRYDEMKEKNLKRK